MVDNFEKIDTIFGSSTTGGSGGCDLCAINLKRFWCTYACAKNQKDFVEVNLLIFRLETGHGLLRMITQVKKYMFNKYI